MPNLALLYDGPWKRVLGPVHSSAFEADLGTLLFENGHAQEGFKRLSKAVDMAPESPEAHRKRAAVLAKIERGNRRNWKGHFAGDGFSGVSI